MEYDRALYRVYERVLEDLCSSSSPLPSGNNNNSNNNNNEGPPPLLPMILPAKLSWALDALLEGVEGRNMDGVVRGFWLAYRSLFITNTSNSNTSGGNTNENSTGRGAAAGGGASHRQRQWQPLPEEDDDEEEDEAVEETTSVLTSGGTAAESRTNLRRRAPRHADGTRRSRSATATSVSTSASGGTPSFSSDEDDNDRSEDEDGLSSSSSSSSASSSAASSEYSNHDYNMPSSTSNPTSSSNNSNNNNNNNNRNNYRPTNARNSINNHRPMLSASRPPSPSSTNFACTRRGLYLISKLAFIGAILHLCILYLLHQTYVGAGVSKHHHHRQLALNQTCLEYALQTRPKEQRGAYFYAYGDEEEDDDTATTHSASLADSRDYNTNNHNKHDNHDGKQTQTNSTKITQMDPPLLGKDEILQVRIIYGGYCKQERCSKVRTVIYPPPNATTTTNATTTSDIQNNDTKAKKNHGSLRGLSIKKTNTGGSNVQSHIKTYLPRRLLSSTQNNDQSTKQTPSNGQTSSIKDHDNAELDDPWSDPSYWEQPQRYRFATNEALLYLDSKLASLHNLTIINVTLTEHCLSTGTDDDGHDHSRSLGSKIAQWLSPIYGMDSVMINQFMYGIRTTDGKYRRGFVQRMDTMERWSWSRRLLEDYDTGFRNNFISWFFRKFGVLVMSLLSFFLITSITSLIVRVLTSSGVVLMFPLFALFRSMGMPGADDRILGLSYPWIGRARSVIRARNIHPNSHLVVSHVAKIFLYYVMYEACQAAWSVVLYAKSVPEALPIWIYGFAMIWEYFSMVFLRSALSVYFFPRITLFYFLLYHIYFYSVPYGYFDVALIPWFLFMLQAMFYTLVALEVPAASRGATSIECPREVYNRLSWPEWTASLPQEWTLFLPLNSRYTPLHDRDLTTTTGTPTTETDPNDDVDGGNIEEDSDDNNDLNDDSEDDTNEGSHSNIRADDQLSSTQMGNEEEKEEEEEENVVVASNHHGLHARRTGLVHR